jgi:hypothetical protein
MSLNGGMAALTTQQEYDQLREAIQKLTTLDANGESRDVVNIGIEGFTTTYSSSRLADYQAREKELAKRLSIRNLRKRVTPDFSGSGGVW